MSSRSSSRQEPPPSYETVVVGATATNRPNLPENKRNKELPANPTFDDPDALVVKFQTIVRDKKEIVVGRLKVRTGLPGPNEHAFILRRYDTSAISVTTMFKAAFPTATNEEEDREMRWIKSTFDMHGMNGSKTCDAVKLAGTWVPPSTAAHIAKSYKLQPWIDAMCRAQPETGVAYRKSQRSQEAAEAAARETASTRQASRTAIGAESTADAPIASRTRRSVTPQPPAHSEQPTPKRTRRETSTSRTSRHEETPAQTIPENEATASSGPMVDVTLTSTTEIRSPVGVSVDAEREIEENRAMVLRMKEEALARSRAGESAEDMGLVASASTAASRGVKRSAAVSAKEEAVELAGGVAKPVATAATSALKDSPKQRKLKANKRIVKPEEAARKQAVWGGILLGAGAGLAYFASQFL